MLLRETGKHLPFALTIQRKIHAFTPAGQLWGVQAHTGAMAESLPRSLRPPVSLALARAVETIPSAGALPGDLVFEPKWAAFFTGPCQPAERTGD